MRLTPSLSWTTWKLIKSPNLDIQQSEVRQQLRLVHRMERFFAFDLNHHSAVDHQISSKPALQLHRPVNQWDRLLPLHLEA